jgi:hypothetical protein
VAEQSVFVGSSHGSGNTSTSGSTQVVERPQGVSRSGSAVTSAGSGDVSARSGRLDAGAKAVPVAAVSFVSGLVGLLVANLVLGPLAIVLGLIGLRVDSGRRARAVLGIVLGIADVAVFVLLAAHAGAHHGSLSWSFFGH